ncbi:16S rRNA (adenine(1518)-N(6)/adenine(1519)-N(6))-dimethyltransferase RsmA [Candidatus Pelagibacter bacterium]|nr:16S rRNA (adenine(1518)-N(6)/adenine(1519)-N(6))-dimethyltransferase RsmA [Candidatus Pelagibacter bacterium]
MPIPKKSLGQNFLIDKNIVNKIICLKNIKNQNILEIGPGRGALTEKILEKKPKTLTLIEKDLKLYEILKKKYQDNNKVKLLNSDILKIDLEKIINIKSIIFGNLPYNISSQILVKLIKFKNWPPKFTDLILMFQKEVAEKITGKSFGRLSVITNYRLKLINKFNVSPNCFYPKPKIISTVLHLSPIRKEIYKIKNLDNLEMITNIFFSNRRKMIKKNFKKILGKKRVKNLNLNLRPSDLKSEIYYKITKLYEE